MSVKKKNTPLDRYRIYLRLEKGLSPRTLEAYMSDVEKLAAYIAEEGGDLLAVELEQLRDYLATLVDVGIHPRTQARLLSSLRSFYGFLKMDGYIESNPTELLKSPKLPMHLPDVLTLDEIDRVIDAIDLSQLEGQRNRAMIEVLYSCGLRVSELCNLKISDLYLDEEFIRVTGKGDKQRAPENYREGILKACRKSDIGKKAAHKRKGEQRVKRQKSLGQQRLGDKAAAEKRTCQRYSKAESGAGGHIRHESYRKKQQRRAENDSESCF